MLQINFFHRSSLIPINRYFLYEILKRCSSSVSSSENENYYQNLTWREKILSKSMPLRSIKDKSIHERNLHFIDYKRVSVKGGKGGDGMICFLHLYGNENAGPSGGDGGNGGHIIFEASKHINSLSRIKSSYTGNPGENGMHKDMTGKNAEHMFINVPVGTLVKNAISGETVADLYCEGIKFLAAKGGAGGKGNHYFLSNKNRHPNVAEIGADGEKNVWILEIKMIAHAGLVGFPNAGKSTLLSALSRAKPKIANYPFTTLKPSIGIVQYDDKEQLSIADLPGIIEGANKNKGLGLDFLKHVERCVCLFYVIDISSPDPFQQLIILLDELKAFNSELINRPSIIIVNKMDIEGSEDKLKLFQTCLNENNLAKWKVIPVSGKYGNNLIQLLVHFRELFDLHHLENLNQNIL